MNTNVHSVSVTPAVSVENLGLRFGDFDALQDISIDIFHGQTLALLGHNGAGKSSLIKLILGLIKPTSGQLTLGNASKQQAVNLGYLPEDVSFYDKLTGLEVLSYFAALKGIKSSRVNQLIEEFELGYAQHKPLKTYSKGMKQRLGVAQAILSKPNILLLDEPTVGLDPQASQFLYQKIDALKLQGCAVIVCTHELSIVEKHLDRALLLAHGRRVASGTLDELRQVSGLKSQVKIVDFNQVVAKDSYLQSFSQGQKLFVNSAERSAVIEYLVQQKSCTAFSVIEPSLEAIYHHCMQQQPERTLSPQAQPPQKSYWQSLQNLLSPIVRQSTL